MNDVVPPPDTTGPKEKSSKSRFFGSLALKIVGVVFLLLAFCLLYYGIIAYIGWRSGEQIRLVEVTEAQEAEMSKQFELAQTDIADGRYELAIRRLDWLLERDSAYSGAAELRDEVQTQINLALTPTATPTLTPTPSPTPEVTATVVAMDTEAADEQITAIEDAVLRGRWEDSVSDIIDFQVNFPSYRRTETDRLLYEAYKGWGLSLIQNTDEIELGLYYLNQAENLGTLPDTVEGERVFAELYVEGIVFYGVNWGAYLYYFRELCSYAPNFQNSCSLLEEGLIAYGDQLAAAQDWCPALDYYREASTVVFPAANGLQGKIQQADEGCLAATPTPGPGVISGTVPITGSIPITNTVPDTP